MSQENRSLSLYKKGVIGDVKGTLQMLLPLLTEKNDLTHLTKLQKHRDNWLKKLTILMIELKTKL